MVASLCSKHSHIPASSLYFHPPVLDGFSVLFLAMPRASLCLTVHQQSPRSHHQLASLHGLCLKPCPQPKPHLPRGRQNPFSPPVQLLSDTALLPVLPQRLSLAPHGSSHAPGCLPQRSASPAPALQQPRSREPGRPILTSSIFIKVNPSLRKTWLLMKVFTLQMAFNNPPVSQLADKC